MTTTYIHVTQGRMRIKIAELKRAPQKGVAIESALRKAHGVTFVKANPLTGSLLVFFDPATTDSERIIKRIAAVGFSLHSPKNSTSRSRAERQRIGDRLVGILFQSVCEVAIKNLIAALI